MTPYFRVKDIYKFMKEEDIQFSYNGYINEEILIAIGDVIKDKMTKDDCDTKIIRKVFSVLVEASYNVLKYSQEKIYSKKEDKASGAGIIGISKRKDNSFFIFTGNLINIHKAKEMEENLKLINSLSKEELNKKYQTQLKHSKIKEDGSAGLGLFEVARKSKRPIDFYFSPVDDNTMFFELKIYIEVEE